jgi:L-lactate dehydrogenase complex protein LldG
VGSREEILKALRAAAPPAAPLPELGDFGLRFPDARERFAQSMTEVGGSCVRLPDLGALESTLSGIPEYASAGKVVSLVPGVARANVDLALIKDPHELNDVDFCVIPGELGVAESGAVWITNHGLQNRAVCYLAQHLAVVLRGDALVDNLHQAYERISIPSPGFAMWLSGPSKTADIEQALVIGAHGARSCTVVLVG